MDKKKNYGERLRQAADTMFGGVQGLAEIWDVKKEGIYSYFRGERLPGTGLLTLLHDAGLNINWLLTGDGEMSVMYNQPRGKSRSVQIPLVANVQCGVPSAEFTANTEKFIEFDGVKGLLNPFAVVAQGNSMSPTIVQGDILICSEPDGPIKDQSICLVSYKTEPETHSGLVKRVAFIEDGSLILYSDNSRSFPPINVKETEIFRLYPVYNKLIRSFK